MTGDMRSFTPLAAPEGEAFLQQGITEIEREPSKHPKPSLQF